LGVTSGDRPLQGFENMDEAKTRLKSDFDSVNGLIERRNLIKSEIVVSNATTKVNIAGKELTISQAIERKSSIALEKSFLNMLRNRYSNAVKMVENSANNVDEFTDKISNALAGKSAKLKDEDIKKITSVVEHNTLGKLVDPNKLTEKIENLENSIVDFEKEVDILLAEANTKTMINIPD